MEENALQNEIMNLVKEKAPVKDKKKSKDGHSHKKKTSGSQSGSRKKENE